MQAVAAPASVRVQALDVIVRHLGPVSLGKRLMDAGDAMEVGDTVAALEERFAIQLDDFWQARSIDELALLVEDLATRRLQSALVPADILDFDAAGRRARRARAPLFPGPTIRDHRLAARALRRRTARWALARLLAAAVVGGASAGVLAFALGA